MTTQAINLVAGLACDIAGQELVPNGVLKFPMLTAATAGTTRSTKECVLGWGDQVAAFGRRNSRGIIKAVVGAVQFAGMAYMAYHALRSKTIEENWQCYETEYQCLDMTEKDADFYFNVLNVEQDKWGWICDYFKAAYNYVYACIWEVEPNIFFNLSTSEDEGETALFTKVNMVGAFLSVAPLISGLLFKTFQNSQFVRRIEANGGWNGLYALALLFWALRVRSDSPLWLAALVLQALLVMFSPRPNAQLGDADNEQDMEIIDEHVSGEAINTSVVNEESAESDQVEPQIVEESDNNNDVVVPPVVRETVESKEESTTEVEKVEDPSSSDANDVLEKPVESNEDSTTAAETVEQSSSSDTSDIVEKPTESNEDSTTEEESVEEPSNSPSGDTVESVDVDEPVESNKDGVPEVVIVEEPTTRDISPTQRITTDTEIVNMSPDDSEECIVTFKLTSEEKNDSNAHDDLCRSGIPLGEEKEEDTTGSVEEDEVSATNSPVEPTIAEEAAVEEGAPPVKEPSVEETAAVEEPESVEEPAVTEAAPAAEEPTVVEEPVTIEEPAAVEEPPVIEEPAVVEVAPSAEAPAAVEEPEAVEEPTAVEEPVPVQDSTAHLGGSEAVGSPAAKGPVESHISEAVTSPVPDQQEATVAPFGSLPRGGRLGEETSSTIAPLLEAEEEDTTEAPFGSLPRGGRLGEETSSTIAPLCLPYELPCDEKPSQPSSRQNALNKKSAGQKEKETEPKAPFGSSPGGSRSGEENAFTIVPVRKTRDQRGKDKGIEKAATKSQRETSNKDQVPQTAARKEKKTHDSRGQAIDRMRPGKGDPRERINSSTNKMEYWCGNPNCQRWGSHLTGEHKEWVKNFHSKRRSKEFRGSSNKELHE